jgi:hypothetical protein
MCNSRSATSVDPAALLRAGMPSSLHSRAKEVRTDFSRRSLGLFNAHEPACSQPRHSWLDMTSELRRCDTSGLDAMTFWPEQRRFYQ